MESLTNTTFVTADACATGLPANRFDFVYCRFLLLHLTDPASCLQRDVALDAFADLFSRLAPLRGVDYLSNRLGTWSPMRVSRS